MKATPIASGRSYCAGTARPLTRLFSAGAPLKKLRQALSEITHKSISEIVDECVNREMDAVLGRKTGPVLRKAWMNTSGDVAT